MPIKEGYLTERQTWQVANSHYNATHQKKKDVSMKTVTNLRRVLCAFESSTGKWRYKKDLVLAKWPQGTYETENGKPKASAENINFGADERLNKYAAIAAGIEQLDISGFGWELKITKGK